ncbi:MAG: 5-amino-6-(D-ribitylamino)uracil--L-tyrosine 4-hydroxyphenyl transferase CofH [Gammaproteobacteria bacterium]|nr:5-amino-6-(D-ribitylamino)uracil--L-tyrosine 4-hydroxyphenyl transferase CofH [Gammaproteobacteria bacterium]MBI5615056.1 5-amino-6-(D-ribitylamino)uracil--L-tyrosine 4-hydroxyphenyl transferase CofH [Gammaproteobacteria bacterium]
MTNAIIEGAAQGRPPSDAEARALADATDLPLLMEAAARLRDTGYRNVITFSKKVFIPLTQLCRDVCHYCTFAKAPKRLEKPYLTLDEVVDIAARGARLGCKEALFTLGEKPELRYATARDALAAMGYGSTTDYLQAAAAAVFEKTGLLPHLNPGTLTDVEFVNLRAVAPSMGLMLESASERLTRAGMPHHGSPDKTPAARLEAIAAAGRARVPFTTGILIGIGETRLERIEALLAIRALHAKFGHIQEIIVQNFRAKPGTKMVDAPEPALEEMLWTLAVARLVFGAEMSVQAPPNLSPGALPQLVAAGINDWGGVSPLTPDYVNPEAPWPHLVELEQDTAAAGKLLIERLTVYPEYALAGERWIDEKFRTPVLKHIDGEGLVRMDGWAPGDPVEPAARDLELITKKPARVSRDVAAILERATRGDALDEAEVVRLFQARGEDFSAVCQAADAVRREVNGNAVTFCVNRNINYTNICYFKCQFCAFSKGKLSENLRGQPYDLELPEIQRRVLEAWERGGTEVCMQGGIHPQYTGETYFEIVRAVKEAVPDMHVHAFSPLEVWQGAMTIDQPLEDYLRRLRAAGLGTLPGTAAEVLDDEVRKILCPDKINTAQWFEVMRTAHKVGLRSTSTIMYGHVDRYHHWARHILRLRELQRETGGFTEFVPLPFVHMEAPLYLKGRARKGPTFREAVLMHAVARLALHPYYANIQASWVKMGHAGVIACLNAGANDLGGTLMNESITRAAGAAHGQETNPDEMQAMIRDAGREPRQRTTEYGEVPEERIEAARHAPELTEIVNTPALKFERNAKRVLVRPGLEA